MSDHSSKNDLYRITDPEADLFSDAMDCAVSAHHSYKHGVMHNAERSGALAVDGEKIARRGLAIAIKAYLEELGPAVETTAPPLGWVHPADEDGPVEFHLGATRPERSGGNWIPLYRQAARIASLKPPPQ